MKNFDTLTFRNLFFYGYSSQFFGILLTTIFLYQSFSIITFPLSFFVALSIIVVSSFSIIIGLSLCALFLYNFDQISNLHYITLIFGIVYLTNSFVFFIEFITISFSYIEIQTVFLTWFRYLYANFLSVFIVQIFTMLTFGLFFIQFGKEKITGEHGKKFRYLGVILSLFSASLCIFFFFEKSPSAGSFITILKDILLYFSPFIILLTIDAWIRTPVKISKPL